MDVRLAVYDLSRGMARSMSQAILGQRIDGIWHTGIVVFGKEYYFGGGIQIMPWGAFAASNSMQPVEVLPLGRTSKTQHELESYLRSVSHLFTQATYDLINHNCNNFSDTVSKFLLNQGIPSHIVDLPRIVFSTPGGAMLRPMLESMQGNIRQQQGFGLDPFGGSAASAESSLSDSMVSMVSNQIALSEQLPLASVRPAELEEKAWVSADAGAVGSLGDKLLNLAAPGSEPGSALSDADKERLRGVLAGLRAASAPAFSVDDYALLEGILARHPEAHMACLFIVRLMFLHDRMTDFAEVALLRQILRRLLGREGAEATAQAGEGKVSGFASVPAHVMALCAISNLLSHQGGLALLHAPSTPTLPAGELSTDLAGDLVDTALSGLSHGRAEVRQMSGTLAYNLTLACTKDGRLSGPWTATPGVEAGEGAELNGQALQLLCACLEGIAGEQDTLVRRRRLATGCRILRAFGAPAAALARDLGLDEALRALRRGADGLSAPDVAIVDELLAHLQGV